MNPAMTLAVVAAFTSMAVVFVVRTFADAVFLANFGVEYLPHFYVAQSASLIGLSFLYTWVIRRGALLVDIIILLGLVATTLAAPVLADRATFALALGLITLSTLGQMAVWNAVTSVVSGRKSRTFLPRAGAAATAGAVAGGFAASGIVGVGGVTALAWVSTGLTLATLGLRVALRQLTERRRSSGAAPAPRRAGGRESARHLVVLLGAGLMVEALLSAFIDFGFKREVTDALHSKDSIGLFFALYYGITNVVLLATQLAAASRLLATRSLRSTLSLEPLVLAASAIAWVAFPVLAIAALTRGLEGVMKFAVMRPAQEVAMTPFMESTRKRLKVILRGVYAPGGAVLAGGILIAAAPLLAANQYVVPGACVALAIALLVVVRATASHYLAALGSDLGLRQISTTRSDPEDEAVLDRDAFAKLVDMCGSDDPRAADLARDMLGRLPGSTAVLAPHVGSGNAATRRAVYELLARRPSRACAAKLAISVAREPDRDGALDAGLLALAAHADASQVARARKLVAGGLETTLVDGLPPPADDDHEVVDQARDRDPVRRAAWVYLSSVGALDDDPEHHRTILMNLVAVDGGTAAAGCAAAIDRGAIAGTVIDESLAELAHAYTGREPATSGVLDAPAEQRRQALIAAASLDRPACIELVLTELRSGSRWGEEIAAQLYGGALARLAEQVLDASVPVRQQLRLLGALRANDRPEVTELAVRVLEARGTAEIALRDQAVSLLLSRQDADLPRAAIEGALDEEMDRFAAYVHARPGYGSAARESQMEVRARGGVVELTAEAFFLDELERCTERSLGRMCALLALLGKPESVFDAERGLRAPTFQRRRQALDVLQEVLHGRQKARLLDLLDRYLMPPRATQTDARGKVIAIDPWLARCANSSPDPAAKRLWALRSAVLFDAIDGDSLVTLAERADEVVVAAKDFVVREGEPGDALYIVIEGVLGVERGKNVVAQLGPGEAFGELALLDGDPRQATVRAHQRSRLLRLPRDTFDAALSAHPEIGLGLVLGLVKWLRQGKDKPRVSLGQTMV